MKQPFRPYSDFADFCIKHTCNNKLECMVCHGSGRIIAPYEKSDPIEGYKLADRIQCQICMGTGEALKFYAKEYYHIAIKEYKKDLAKWEKWIKVKEQIEKKLTKEEIDFIKYQWN